ncbi:MAG: hypothetical protein CM15mP85_04720 [Rhodobacterales bacterium]|nr:MAG: hypothetical protein CM15mP85_04720 [Rhodobacterales bacterium]
MGYLKPGCVFGPASGFYEITKAGCFGARPNTVRSTIKGSGALGWFHRLMRHQLKGKNF